MISLGNVVFKRNKKIKDIKLKLLQIRIVHQILATNVVLMKMGIVNCSKCTFCEDNKDSIDHIFGQCSCIKCFWQILESKLNTKCIITFQARITQNFVLFGLDSHNSVKTDEMFGFIIPFCETLQLSMQKKHILTPCGYISETASAEVQSRRI